MNVVIPNMATHLISIKTQGKVEEQRVEATEHVAKEWRGAVYDDSYTGQN